MTTIEEDARSRPLIGPSVGQAQAALTRLLTGILAESGTSHRAWLGLQRLSALGGQPARDVYERDVSDWLLLDGPEAARLAGDLIAAGLAAADGDAIRITDAGRALRQAVLTRSAQVTGPILATVDRGDLETAIRTLDEITRRVRETFVTEGS
jgi:DNA-binding MarR family transcriptional regulator